MLETNVGINRIDNLNGRTQLMEVWRTVKTIKIDNRHNSNEEVTQNETKPREIKEPGIGIEVTNTIEECMIQEI